MVRSFEMHSAFSGMMCWEDTVRWHFAALASRLGVKTPDVRVYKTCDIDNLSLDVMRSRKILRPEKMFYDVLDRIPAEARAEMAMKDKRSEQPTSLELTAHHEEIFRDQLANGQKYFPIDATALNVLTGQPDFVYSPNQQARDHASSESGLAASTGKPVIMTGAGTPCVPFSRRTQTN